MSAVLFEKKCTLKMSGLQKQQHFRSALRNLAPLYIALTVKCNSTAQKTGIRTCGNHGNHRKISNDIILQARVGYMGWLQSLQGQLQSRVARIMVGQQETLPRIRYRTFVLLFYEHFELPGIIFQEACAFHLSVILCHCILSDDVLL